MKRNINKLCILIAFLMSFCNISKAQYDVYFTDQQLRIDYYIFGNSDSCHYLFACVA